jgi:hypothetical protein
MVVFVPRGFFNMRVTCPHCSQKALITSTSSLNDTKTITDLYCSCTNVKACGATFVYTLSFNHAIKTPARTVSELALNLVNRMSKEEKAALQQELFA